MKSVLTVEKQYSVFLANKPGVLAKVCQKLAESRVNIKALTLVDSQEHGVMRLLVENGAKVGPMFVEMGLAVSETDVMCVEMANHPGAMADICTRLAAEHININYAYCTTGSKGGKTLGVFKIGDLQKARKVLEKRVPMRKKAAPIRKTRAAAK